MSVEDRTAMLRDMQICRFCLGNDQPLFNLYDKTSKEKQIVPLPLQIMACVAIEVFASDGMPQLICRRCRLSTLQAYSFKSNCKKADDALKTFLATGHLSKPIIRTFEDEDLETQPRPPMIKPKVVQIKSQIIDQKPPKRVKLEQNEEIITLNFEESEDSLPQGSNANESILGMEEDDEGTTAPEGDTEDDEAFEAGDGEDNPRIARLLNTKQVKTEIFPCPQCERSFPLEQLRDLHVVNHQREKSFECDQCNRSFYTKYDLTKHLQTHSQVKTFACVVCNKMFTTETLLLRHEKTHNDAPKYMCIQCDKTFLTKESRDMHVDKHKKKRPFTCTICNKSFVFKQGLERHEQIHATNKPHKCNYCEASFSSAIKLTRHITSHAGLRPYPCKICGRTFLLSHHLTRHMRSHYAAKNADSADTVIHQFKCDSCSMSFRRKDSLINHSAIHSMVNLRCAICHINFDDATMVKEHITSHLSGLPYPCEKCDYSFETVDQLEVHQIKHAEMEYEEQIEKEVIMEAQRDSLEEGDAEHFGDDDDTYEDDDVTEFTLTNDMSNPEVVRRSKRKAKGKETYSEFFKDELASDSDDMEVRPPAQESAEAQSEEEQPEDIIKPIVRTEGTKVYTRRQQPNKKPPVLAPASVAQVASLDEITQSPPQTSSIDTLNLESLTSQPKKLVKMKVGDKTVKVQKYIITKEEMKNMAKQGLLEMRGGTVLLKKPGLLNSTMKAVNSLEMESMIQADRVKLLKQTPKTYERRAVSGEDSTNDSQQFDNDESSLQEILE